MAQRPHTNEELFELYASYGYELEELLEDVSPESISDEEIKMAWIVAKDKLDFLRSKFDEIEDSLEDFLED
jgi:hypothetical protein